MRKSTVFTCLMGGMGILAGVALVQMLDVPSGAPESGAARLPWGEHYGELPLLFEPAGDGAGTRYVARAPGYMLQLAQEGVSVVTGDAKGRLGLRWKGGNEAVMVAQEPQATRVNYLIGGDSQHWRTGLPTYASVRYRNVYDGIDLVFYGQRRALEYDFVVAAGVDPGVIAFDYEGARSLRIDDAGDLWIGTGAGELRQHRPRAYQPSAQGHRPVAAEYVVGHDGSVKFRLAAYDPALPLVIDPVLEYATLAGGGGVDRITGMAVDAAGNAYVVGTTSSVDFGTQGQAYGGAQSDAFVARLDPSGTRLDYVTYLGGAGVDEAHALALAPDGIFITGMTRSADFPTQGGRGVSLNGGAAASTESDVFVAKLGLAGNTLAYSTLVGGADLDAGAAIARDAAGAVYVTGTTWSRDFPLANAYQTRRGGNIDAFVFKLNAQGDALEYSTYLGALNGDFPQAIAVDGAGRAYVGGFTFAPDFPQVQGLAPQPASNSINGFVTLFAADGGSLVYSTLLGGAGEDRVAGLAVAGAGGVWVTGETTSNDFPITTGGAYHGGRDAFLLHLDETGSGAPTVAYGAYWGGSGPDRAAAVAVGAEGDIYLAGTSGSADANFGVPVQVRPRGGLDGFVLRLDAAALTPVYSSFIGGTMEDAAAAVAVGPGGDAFVAGTSASSDFPFINAAPGALRGASDAFVARVSGDGAAANLSLAAEIEEPEVPPGGLASFTLTVSNAGPDEAGNVQLRAELAPELLFAASTASQGSCSQLGGILTCAVGTIGPAAQASVEVRAFVQQVGTHTLAASVSTDSQEIETRDNVAQAATTTVAPAPTGGGGDGSGGGNGGGDDGGGSGSWSWIGLGAAWWLRRGRRNQARKASAQ